MLGIWSIVPKVNTILLDSFLPDPNYAWSNGEEHEQEEAVDSALNHLALVPFEPQ